MQQSPVRRCRNPASESKPFQNNHSTALASISSSQASSKMPVMTTVSAGSRSHSTLRRTSEF